MRSVLEDEVREIYTYQRGHLRPPGLFDLLAEHPDEVIVLDDLGAVLKSHVALQILPAALEPPTSRDRVRAVKHRRRGVESRVDFGGSIICISNVELHDDDLPGAFKSRVQTLDYDPSDAQLGALMLDVASRGWPAHRPETSPEKALEVAEHLIAEMIRLGCRFDVRLLVGKALPDYQQWADGEAESDRRDLVTSSIGERLGAVRREAVPAATREARMAEDRAAARRIFEAHPSREGRAEAWIALTGKSERAYYRRLAETS
ncbi:hypothetical protein [Paludisphaera mucosa]|uniref:Uncharacterized protein n=1 Tax=Paludisphaera mucosa TaxID=3030827 RepID=A0ABT6FLR8_9BACT|nr:hypothetical protein [Paludisphaera mucosa]MDG3008305.1 hypothetical protein [Paludisphaera mucosa]